MGAKAAWSAAGIGVLCIALSCAALAGRVARAEPPVTLPIVFHVADVEDTPVVSEAFLAQRIARTNQIFAPYGVQFRAVRRVPLGAEHAALENRQDRDALGSEVLDGVINCFVVRSLRDVDEPSRMRRGVHWHAASPVHGHAASPVHGHAASPVQTHFVILSSIAEPDVLAHELGHFLGNPHHSDTPGNLMSYQRGNGLPFLDAEQQARVRRALRDCLRRGALHAVPAAPAQ